MMYEAAVAGYQTALCTYGMSTCCAMVVQGPQHHFLTHVSAMGHVPNLVEYLGMYFEEVPAQEITVTGVPGSSIPGKPHKSGTAAGYVHSIAHQLGWQKQLQWNTNYCIEQRDVVLSTQEGGAHIITSSELLQLMDAHTTKPGSSGMETTDEPGLGEF